MKILYWLLLLLSAIFYAFPFLFSDFLWWLIFIFPVPLLYITRTQNLSFLHGYIWGIVVFGLHLSGGIFVIANLAHNVWWIGFLMGVAMIFYQALAPALFFWCTTIIVTFFSITSSMLRLLLWSIALAFFIFWTDRYCMWIFGIQEGYPCMFPLILLAQQPSLLLFLPVIGKQLLTILFLLISIGFVFLLWYKNISSFLFAISICLVWLFCWALDFDQEIQSQWYHQIKSLPYMVHTMSNNSEVVIKVVVRHIKDIIGQYPDATTIIMPESAFNITDFESKQDLLRLWSEEHLGKKLHIIFGACRWKEGKFYNSLHWVHNGVLQTCFDKKHAMLITERLSDWMNYNIIRSIYFKDGLSVTRSANNRIIIKITEKDLFVPYICSELFFTELPDDRYDDIPIIVIVNDTLLLHTYIQKLLLLLARFKAIQWHREIVYISYYCSVFINKQGVVTNVNE